MPRAQEKGAHEKAEFLQGTDVLILNGVAAGPLHGRAVSQRIQLISNDFFQLPQGSLYPALHPREEHGGLEAERNDTATGGEARVHLLPRASRGRSKVKSYTGRNVRMWFL